MEENASMFFTGNSIDLLVFIYQGVFKIKACETSVFLQRGYHSLLVDISINMHKLCFSYRSIDKSLEAQISRNFQGMFSVSITQLREHIELRIVFAPRVMRRLHRCTRLSEKLLVRQGVSLTLMTTCEET